ncbi:unnamed protein product [Acanthocheilonema viteae]|uniref:Band 7 domain-containing protein n=1 Tax=Acanthocheilonema viteae TaxID=6277 RepID=A0A498SNG8_ACAVI|nr:unnamed protein product [Acanthocheilonema viteae]
MNPYHRHHLANSALNPTHSYLIDDRSKSVTSSNNKDDFPLSDSSDETKNSTMEILDNLIEQLPKSSSIIAKKNQMCSVNGLSDDQPHIDVIKFDTNMLQQSSIEAEYDPNVQSELGFCGWILTILSYILIFLTLPISVCMCVKVVQEYERVVIFRLGRLMPGGAKGPGIFFIVPCIDTYRKVDLRVISFEVPPQEITLDEATEPWGVKVERVEVKDVRLPVQLQRAMAAEAEAARGARAKVIAAEGEQKASQALKEAAEVIAESPSALQLRYLQTLNSISAEKNSTIIFPFPIDLLSSLVHRAAPKM